MTHISQKKYDTYEIRLDIIQNESLTHNFSYKILQHILCVSMCVYFLSLKNALWAFGISYSFL